MASELVTAKEAAHTLRVHRSTVYKLIKQGLLPAPIKVGAKSYWLQSDIDTLIQRGATC